VKVYIILEYKREISASKENIYAEVRAFTSATQRDKVFAGIDKTKVDVEPLDIEVEKRPYEKPEILPTTPVNEMKL
jgi:uncharacterized alkaline shock family protein YloU